MEQHVMGELSWKKKKKEKEKKHTHNTYFILRFQSELSQNVVSKRRLLFACDDEAAHCSWWIFLRPISRAFVLESQKDNFTSTRSSD